MSNPVLWKKKKKEKKNAINVSFAELDKTAVKANIKHPVFSNKKSLFQLLVLKQKENVLKFLMFRTLHNEYNGMLDIKHDS